MLCGATSHDATRVMVTWCRGSRADFPRTQYDYEHHRSHDAAFRWHIPCQPINHIGGEHAVNVLQHARAAV